LSLLSLTFCFPSFTTCHPLPQAKHQPEGFIPDCFYFLYSRTVPVTCRCSSFTFYGNINDYNFLCFFSAQQPVPAHPSFMPVSSLCNLFFHVSFFWMQWCARPFCGTLGSIIPRFILVHPMATLDPLIIPPFCCTFLSVSP